MLKHLINVKLAFVRLLDEEGQGLTEYVLIVSLVALVAIVAVTFMGNKVTTELSTIARSV